jgi:hypothetical protein
MATLGCPAWGAGRVVPPALGRSSRLEIFFIALRPSPIQWFVHFVVFGSCAVMVFDVVFSGVAHGRPEFMEHMLF